MPVVVSSAVGAQRRFLAELSDPFRRQVAWLSDLLNDSTYDSVVFTARKAACLADSLQRIGYLKSNASFTSTRILDGDCSHITGTNVLLVEDIVSSGRTMLRALAALTLYEPASIACVALSAEGRHDNLSNELRSRVPGLDIRLQLRSTPSESLNHARSIVNAFRALPRPYNIDWPIYELEVSRARLDFTYAQHSLRYQPRGRHDPFNLIPNSEQLRVIDNVLPGWALKVVPHLQLKKVRVYPIPSDEPDESTGLFAVPIAALGPLTLAEIDRLYEITAVAFGEALDTGATASERYRVLQYILSVLLFGAGVGKGMVYTTDHQRDCQYLFAPRHRSCLLKTLDSLGQTLDGFELPRVAKSRVLHAASYVDRSIQVLVDDAAETAAEHVLKSYLDKQNRETDEYKIRQQLRDRSDNLPRKEFYEKLLSLEREGNESAVTPQRFERVLKDAGVLDPDLLVSISLLVSDFLDRGIDSGAVVPEVVNDGITICRKFRPGEVIEFNAETIALVELALRTYWKESGRPSISADMVQKIVIGLTRHLILRRSRKDYRALRGERAELQLLQYRYHLRGTVLTDPSDDFVADPGRLGSISVLLDEGVLLENKGQDGYLLPTAPCLPAPPLLASDAYAFGKLAALILSMEASEPAAERRRSSRLLNQDDFALLITLAGELEETLALGADIAIATNQLEEAMTAPRLSKLTSSPFNEALRNGVDKAWWIGTARTDAVVRAITTRLQGEDEMLKHEWLAIAAGLNRPERDRQLAAIQEEECSWICDAYILYIARTVLLAAAHQVRERVEHLTKGHIAILLAKRKIRRRSRTKAGLLEAVLLEILRVPTFDRMALHQGSESLAQELRDWGGRLQCRCHEAEYDSVGRRSTLTSLKNVAVLIGDVEWEEQDLLDLGRVCPSIGPNLLRSEAFGAVLQFSAILEMRPEFDNLGAARLLESIAHRREREGIVLLYGLPNHLAPRLDGEVATFGDGLHGLVAAVVDHVAPSRARVAWRAGGSAPLGLRDSQAETISFHGSDWRCAQLPEPPLRLPFEPQQVDGGPVHTTVNYYDIHEGAHMDDHSITTGSIQQAGVIGSGTFSGTWNQQVNSAQVSAEIRRLAGVQEDPSVADELEAAATDIDAGHGPKKRRLFTRELADSAQALGLKLAYGYLSHALGLSSG